MLKRALCTVLHNDCLNAVYRSPPQEGAQQLAVLADHQTIPPGIASKKNALQGGAAPHNTSPRLAMLIAWPNLGRLLCTHTL